MRPTSRPSGSRCRASQASGSWRWFARGTRPGTPRGASGCLAALMLRWTWPGNTEQLWQVMRRVVQHRRAGAIQPSDLPPECWTVSRRLLSPLESIERDAIVQALLDSGGNKLKAAKSLGMSRATIYRKVHEYGIVAPASLPARPLPD